MAEPIEEVNNKRNFFIKFLYSVLQLNLMVMKTKLFLTGLALIAATSVLTAQTSNGNQAKGRSGQGVEYVDSNNDGVCDNYVAGQGQGNGTGMAMRGGNGQGQGKRNGNGEGIGNRNGNGNGDVSGNCENFVDADNNGVCDLHEAK
jgi:hypothetical protein